MLYDILRSRWSRCTEWVSISSAARAVEISVWLFGCRHVREGAPGRLTCMRVSRSAVPGGVVVYLEPQTTYFPNSLTLGRLYGLTQQWRRYDKYSLGIVLM